MHGKEMDKAIELLAAERPSWGRRLVKGAWWRASINLQFFSALQATLVDREAAA